MPVQAEIDESIGVESNQFLKIESCALLLIFSLLERCASLYSSNGPSSFSMELISNSLLSISTTTGDLDTTRSNEIGFSFDVLDQLSRCAKLVTATREKCKVTLVCARNVELLGIRGEL